MRPEMLVYVPHIAGHPALVVFLVAGQPEDDRHQFHPRVHRHGDGWARRFGRRKRGGRNNAGGGKEGG